MTNNKKQRTMNHSKQSQTNPIYSVFIRVHSWLNSKQTQTKPTCGELVEPILPATTFGGQSQIFGFLTFRFLLIIGQSTIADYTD